MYTAIFMIFSVATGQPIAGHQFTSIPVPLETCKMLLVRDLEKMTMAATIIEKQPVFLKASCEQEGVPA